MCVCVCLQSVEGLSVVVGRVCERECVSLSFCKMLIFLCRCCCWACVRE